MIWDKSLSDIMDRICESEDIQLRYGKRAVEIMFKMTRRCMEMPDMPTILLKGLGKFNINPDKMRFVLGKLDKQYKEGRIGEEEYNEKKQRYQSILNRRLNEKVRRRKTNIELGETQQE